MTNLDEIQKKKDKLAKLLREADRLARGGERQRDASRKQQSRASARDLTIEPCENERRRKARERDVFRFLNGYFPDTFTDPWTDHRRQMVRAILDAATYGGDQAIAAPRGEGKTSIAECVTIFCLLSGLVHFPLICAATGPDADRILTNIKLQFETNELLAADYPEVCAPIVALEGAPQRAGMQTVNGSRTLLRWGGSFVVFPTVEGSKTSGAVLMTRGLDAAIRGIRYATRRPDLVLIDDPETRESVESDMQTETRELVIEQDLAGLGGPGKRLARVMLTTIMNRKCLSQKYTDPDKKPSWHGVRHKLLEKKPDDEEAWDEYIQLRQSGQQEGDTLSRKAHRFYWKNRKRMNAGAQLSNPHRFISELLADGTRQEVSALQHCYNLIADRGHEAFDTEYQNDPPDPNAGLAVTSLTDYRVKKQLSGYPRGVIPPDCKFLTAALDVRKIALHWVVDAWRSDATGYGLDYGVQEVWSTDPTDEQATDRALLLAMRDWWETLQAAPYQTPDEQPRQVDAVLIDAGWRTDIIYHFCREVGRPFWPAMGFGQSPGATKANFRPPLKPSKTKKSGDGWFLSRQPAGQWLVCMDSDRWKRWVHDRFLTPRERPGAFTLFGEPGSRVDERVHFSHAKHLTNEEEKEEFIRGKGIKRVWVVKSHTNHWFDARYMSAVAASMLGVRLLGARPAVKRQRIKLSEMQAARRKRT